MNVLNEVSNSIEKLRFNIEVLNARLEIKNFFLNNSVKEVYENVGQLLSTVKMNIEGFVTVDDNISAEDLQPSGELLGQSIRELRKMTKGFHADENLLKEDFMSQLNYVIEVFGFNGKIVSEDSFDAQALTDNFKLITFKLLIYILLSIREQKGELQTISLAYQNGFFLYVIKYIDQNFKAGTQPEDKSMLEVLRVLAMIKGEYSTQKNASCNEIFLKISSKTNHHE